MGATKMINRPMKILHIDDDPDSLKFTKVFLEKLVDFIEVQSEENPRKALDLIRSQPFSCIVCDYLMPQITGIELVHLVKKLTDAPFILYTGQGSEEVAEAAFAAGVNDYVRKEPDPSHYQILINRIAMAVEKHRAEEETRRTQAVIESFMESATDGFCILDSDLNYIDVNQVILDRRGLTKEQIIGRNILELYPMVEASGRSKDYRRVIRTGEPFYAEVLDLDHGQKYYQLKAFKVGEGLGIISTDVTPLKRFEARLNALHVSSTRLNQAMSLKEISCLTTQTLSEALGYSWGDVGFTEGDEYVFYWSVSFEFPERVSIPLSGNSVIIRALRSRQTQMVPDVRLDPDYTILKFTGQKSPRNLSELTVPIVIDGVAVGAVNVESPNVNAYDEDDRKLLEVLAQHVASALRRIRELENTKREMERLEALNQHILSLNSAESVDEVLNATYVALDRILGFEVIDVIKVKDGLPTDYVAREPSDPPYRLPLDGVGVTVRAARTKMTQLVPDVRLDPEYATNKNTTLCELAVPVVVDDEAVAVLNVEKAEPNSFTEQEKKLMETLASHVSSAIKRIQQLEELNRSEERYRVVVENTSDAIFVLNSDRYLYVNRRAVELLGYDDPEELLMSEPFKHIDDVDRERVCGYVEARQRGEEAPSRYTFTIRRRDGTPIVIDNSVSRIIFDGKPASLAINRDITSQIQYEETLTALHNYAVRLGLVKTVQEVASTTLDIMEQVFGWNFISFQVIEDNLLVNVDSRGAQPRGVPLPLTGPGLTVRAAMEMCTVYVHDVHADPGYVVVNDETASELAVPVVAQGQVFAVLNMESPEVEAFTPQDAKLLEILAMHVGTAMIRLDHEAELKKVSEDKFSSIMRGFERVGLMIRHDLRNPLQNIRNASKMIDFNPEDSAEMLSIIDKNVDYMAYIVDDLRNLVNPKTLQTETVCVDDIIRRSFDKRILPSGIILKMSLKACTPMKVDVTKLTRVVDNIVNNAVEAMPDGGTLRVSTSESDGEATIRVKDTGHGISDSDIGKLFQPFFSTKRSGMSLGLSYCKEVAEAHGGSIQISSKVNKGTTASLRLPMRRE